MANAGKFHDGSRYYTVDTNSELAAFVSVNREASAQSQGRALAPEKVEEKSF